MPKIIFSTCSQLVSVDRFTNTLSLFHMIEQLNAPSFPFRMPQMFVSVLWQREPQDEGLKFESVVRLTDPLGKTNGEWKAEWVFEQLRHRHILLVANAEFESPGSYHFNIFIKRQGEIELGEPVSTIEIVVQKSQ